MAKIIKIKKVDSADEKLRLNNLKAMVQEKRAIDRFIEEVFGVKSKTLKQIK